MRADELDKALRKLSLDESERAIVEALSVAIVNKVLHAPVSRLRSQAEREEGLAYLDAARELFALDDPEAPGADADEEDLAP